VTSLPLASKKAALPTGDGVGVGVRRHKGTEITQS